MWIPCLSRVHVLADSVATQVGQVRSSLFTCAEELFSHAKDILKKQVNIFITLLT